MEHRQILNTAIIKEEQNAHTGLLRLGLAVSQSKLYWERARDEADLRRLLVRAQEEKWYPAASTGRSRYLVRQLHRRFPAPFPADIRETPHLTPPLICHWHLQLSDPLYRLYTGEYLLSCWSEGSETVTLEGTVGWVSNRPMTADWQPATIRRLASGLLSSAAAAGLCTQVGRSERELRVPSPTAEDVEYLDQLLQRAEAQGNRSLYRVSVGLVDEGNA